MEFEDAVEEAIEEARAAAEETEPDPDADTRIAYVDGRKSFARAMKEHGEAMQGGTWWRLHGIGVLNLQEGYMLDLEVTDEFDFEASNVKVAACEAFAGRMESEGWDVDLRID